MALCHANAPHSQYKNIIFEGFNGEVFRYGSLSCTLYLLIWKRPIHNWHRTPRKEVWQCLIQAGAKENIVKVIRYMHLNSETAVRSEIGKTEAFNVNVGLHLSAIRAKHFPIRGSYGCCHRRSTTLP